MEEELLNYSLFILDHVFVQATVTVSCYVSSALCDRRLLLLLLMIRMHLRVNTQQTAGQEEEQSLPAHTAAASPHSAGHTDRSQTDKT